MTELGKKQQLVRWFVYSHTMPTPNDFKKFAKVQSNRSLHAIISRWSIEGFIHFKTVGSKIILIPGDWSEFNHRGWDYRDKYSRYYG